MMDEDEGALGLALLLFPPWYIRNVWVYTGAMYDAGRLLSRRIPSLWMRFKSHAGRVGG